MEIKMKVRNVALSAAQFGIGFAGGAAMMPFLYAGGLATIAKVVSTVVQDVSFKVVGEISEQLVVIDKKLEALKEKEPEIVESPIGDSAVAVN
jgi:hypothetical protein